MAEAETVTKKGATVAVGKRVVIGSAVGLGQIAWEKIDEDRGVDEDSFTALQNIAPMLITAVGTVMTVLPKSNTVRTFGADLTSSGSTMLSYRLGKLGTSRISSMKGNSMSKMKKIQKLQQLARKQGNTVQGANPLGMQLQ